MQLIRDSVGDPAEWQDNGGEYSAVWEFNDELIVKTSPKNHKDIEELLKLLYKRRTRMVSMHGAYYLVSTKLLRQALAAQKDKLVLDAKAADAFVKKLEAGGAKRLGSGRTVCFNGQRVFVSALSEQMFLSDQQPIPDTDTVDPTISTALHGMSLDVRPTIEPSGGTGGTGGTIILTVVSDLVTGSQMRKTELHLGIPKSKDDENGRQDRPAKAKEKTVQVDPQSAWGNPTKLELPEHDMISHRGTIVIPDGGAVVLTATSKAVKAIGDTPSEVVLILRAKATSVK